MSTNRRKPGAHDDERKFFRVNDEIYLEFRVLTEVPRDKSKLPLTSKNKATVDVLSELTAVNAQIHPLIEAIKRTDITAARCLEAINKKIDLLARAVSKTGETFRVTRPNRKVNLSAGGVAFNVSTQLLPGTPVEVRLAIVATSLVITTYGEVSYCEQEGNDREQPFRVGIKFPSLSVSDRQALFTHVLGRHTEKLRGANNITGGDTAGAVKSPDKKLT